jgi:DNA-binding transcriptional LysR family regulator
MTMKLPSQQLEAFFTVAQTGHFTKAADRLFMTQSALSQRVLNLEEQLGATLFVRERAGPRLTETGEKLLRFCQMTLALEQELLGSFSPHKEGLVGEIRIGGFSSVMRSVILPSLAPLLKNNPRLRLNLVTRELRELSSVLRQGEVDYVILGQDVEKIDLTSVFLGEEQNILVEKRGYSGPEVFLDHDEDDQTTYNYFKQAKSPKKRLERLFFDDVYGILDAAIAGIGRAVLPIHLVKGEKNLAICKPQTALRVPVYLHFYSQPYYSRLHEEVVAALSENAHKFLEK